MLKMDAKLLVMLRLSARCHAGGDRDLVRQPESARDKLHRLRVRLRLGVGLGLPGGTVSRLGVRFPEGRSLPVSRCLVPRRASPR